MKKTNSVMRLDGVYKVFGGLQVLTDVSLTVGEAEIVGLIGPNGAGKSTLFNVMTSFYKPERGDVYLRERRITGLPPHKVCHLGVARTYQLVKAFLKMTVFQNVMVGAVFGFPQRDSAPGDRAEDALKLVGLYDKRDWLTARATLSDRRLLEVAMALASMPKILLLDEPMAGLNPSEIHNLLGVIKKARDERQMAILWVEHKVDAVLDFCERVVVLDYGLKIADGTPAEVAKNPKVIEAYLGEPSA